MERLLSCKATCSTFLLNFLQNSFGIGDFSPEHNEYKAIGS